MSANTLPAPAPCIVSFRLKLFLRLFAVTLVAIQAWNGRHATLPDGIWYLDIADAYLHGDWHAAVSTYWSPLYSWLLAGALFLLRPSPYWEFATLKVVNLGVFLGALAAFEWLLSEAIRSRRERLAPVESATLPPGVLFVVGYAFFLWSSCILTTVATGTPDLLVSMFLYLAAAAVLRGRRVAPSLRGSAILGMILGVGCLAKAVLLPVGVVFVAASAFGLGSVRKAAVHVAAAGIVVLVIFGGFVAAMSARAGRVTLGDVSRLNYLWLVDGVSDHGWETDDPRLGTAVHPPRRLTSDPAVYEFAEPVAGTNPLWNDPTYWTEGLTWRFDLGRQAHAVIRNLRMYYGVLFFYMGPLTAAVVLLHLGAWTAAGESLRAGGWARLRALAGEHLLLAPSLTAFGLYGLVVVEPRYLAGFSTLLGVALLRSIRCPAAKEPDLHRWAWAATAVLVVAPTVWFAAREARLTAEGAGRHVQWQVAEALQKRGVRAGDRVGHIGSTFDSGWARAGRFKIAAEVRTRDVPAWWAADSVRQDALMDAFRQAGVVALVAEKVPESAQGWERIQGTKYAVRMVSQPDGREAYASGR